MDRKTKRSLFVKPVILTGNRIWHPHTTVSGKITAQALPVSCHWYGTSGVLTMTTPAINKVETRRGNQNLYGGNAFVSNSV
jgi:hypothetical protein